MDKFSLYMLMRDASLKQRIPYIMRTAIFGPFSARKKCALYMGKYGILINYLVIWDKVALHESDIVHRLTQNTGNVVLLNMEYF